MRAGLMVAVLVLCGQPAGAATLAVCRMLDVGGAPSAPLTIPAASLFRDVGRVDDPLAAFTGDHWQLRLETVADAVIPSLQTCTEVQARVTSDSSVKAVNRFDNRSLIYAGSNDLLDLRIPSEALMSLTARVID